MQPVHRLAEQAEAQRIRHACERSDASSNTLADPLGACRLQRYSLRHHAGLDRFEILLLGSGQHVTKSRRRVLEQLAEYEGFRLQHDIGVTGQVAAVATVSDQHLVQAMNLVIHDNRRHMSQSSLALSRGSKPPSERIAAVRTNAAEPPDR